MYSDFISTIVNVLLGFVLGIGIIIALAFILRWLIRLRFKHQADLDILLLTVPRYTSSENKGQDDSKVKEILSQMENLFSAIGGLKAQKGFMAWLLGRDDHLTVEIVAKHGEITFYAAVAKKYREYFIQQLQSVNEHVHIQETEDYNIFQKQTTITGTYLKLKRSFVLPLKTYQALEFDPLQSITTAMSKLEEGDGLAVQYVVRSARSGWHKKSQKVIAALNEGKGLKTALQGGGTSGANAGDIASGLFKDLTSSARSSKEEEKKATEKINKQPSQLDLEVAKAIEQKNMKAGMDVNIRVISSSINKLRAETNLHNLINAFTQYNLYDSGNAFKSSQITSRDKLIRAFINRDFCRQASILLNSEELVGLWHLPGDTIDTPNIRWLQARKASPPNQLPKQGLLIGRSDYRGQQTDVRIKEADRRRHMYIIGQTGTGKTEMMKFMAVQDVLAGNGLCIIDPHGDFVEDILANIPSERAEDVIVFDPSDTARPMGLNMLEFYDPEQKTFVINEIIKIFDKLYNLKVTGGPMFEQYMRNTIMLMMEDIPSGSTLMEVSRVLADEDFRKYKLSKSTNPVVRDFWLKEAQKAGGEASLANMVPYITSKLTQFVANDIMRPIIAQQTSSFNFREVMDQKKILLVNLSKGKIGEMNSNLLGMVIVGKILMAALSRVDTPEEQRSDFYLYIDEFQNVITDSIAVILSEARKYKLDLIVAHQYITQLVKENDTQVRDAVFGNVGTKVAFRIGTDDAEFMAKEFAPVFSEYDLINIPKFSAYVKLLIDNQNPPAFNILTIQKPKGSPEQAEKIKQLSRLKYGRPRAEVEAEILQRTAIKRVVEPPVAPQSK